MIEQYSSLTIPILEIRPVDIACLLLGGALLELVSRTLSILAKRKSSTQKKLEQEYRILQYETAKKRRLGPSAFVEISKLERQVLQKEKEITALKEERDERTAVVAKLIKNGSLGLYIVIFVLYFGIPMVSFDGLQIDSDDLESTSEDRARSFLNALLFPISYIGVGIKIAKIGFESNVVGIGALVVLWSSQVTIGKVVDCVEAVLL